jgi:hypothetical protein
VLRSGYKIAAAVGILTLFMGSTASAHGSLTIDEDKCVLNVGGKIIHFSGYQPLSSRTTEFCEDIPSVGKTVVVMDLVDAELRDAEIEVKIVPATDSFDEASRAPVVHVPFAKHPTGSISFSNEFKEPGDFIGLVTAGTKNGLVARFPFSVGKPRTTVWHYAAAGSALFLAVMLSFRFGMRRREQILKDVKRG